MEKTNNDFQLKLSKPLVFSHNKSDLFASFVPRSPYSPGNGNGSAAAVAAAAAAAAVGGEWSGELSTLCWSYEAVTNRHSRLVCFLYIGAYFITNTRFRFLATNIWGLVKELI